MSKQPVKLPPGAEAAPGVGIALGAGIGVAIGVAQDNIGLWVAVGVALGAAVGTSVRAAAIRRLRGASDDEPEDG